MQHYDNKETMIKILTKVDMLPLKYIHTWASQGIFHYQASVTDKVILTLDKAMQRVDVKLVDEDSKLIKIRTCYFRAPIYLQLFNQLQKTSGFTRGNTMTALTQKQKSWVDKIESFFTPPRQAIEVEIDIKNTCFTFFSISKRDAKAFNKLMRLAEEMNTLKDRERVTFDTGDYTISFENGKMYIE